MSISLVFSSLGNISTLNRPYISHASLPLTLDSRDILVVGKNAVSHAFVDTLEPIADDEEAYVKNVVVVERGNHNQQLVKATTAEGENWVYLSGQWSARPDGDQPVASTAADLFAMRKTSSISARSFTR